MTHHIFKSISFRLATLAWVMIIVTLGMFAVSMLPLQRSMIEERMTTEARDIANSISQVTATALVTEDYSFVVEHCYRLVRESKSILYIAIVRKNGFSLVHTAQGWKQDTLRDDWTTITEKDTSEGKILYSPLVGENVFRLVSPFAYSGLDWGWIHVGLSLKKYNADMEHVSMRTIIIAVACIFFGLFASVGYGRKLSRPIRELDASTQRIASGDLTSRVHITSGDELERLANSFNLMTAEWQKSHSELLLSQEFTSNIIKSLNDMLIVVNNDGTIRMVNAATLEQLGYTETELIGNYLASIQAIDADRRNANQLLEEGTSARVESTFRTKSGKSIPVLFSTTVLKNADHAVDGQVCVAVDITQRKKYERELQLGHERLEKRVVERTAELAETNQSLQHEIQENLKAREQLLASLREKEVLLKEIHHRVKNNLQVISSLLNMQASTIKDPYALEAFAESKHRVKSMAMIHEKLYQANDLAHIDFGEYAHNLASSLLHSYGNIGQRVTLSVRSESIYLDVETAIPCGLIINELITNAMKYAFPEPRQGTISVHVNNREEGIELVVGDDGIGLPANFRFEEAETLGLRLVKILTNQLHATFEIVNGHGTYFHFNIPKHMK